MKQIDTQLTDLTQLIDKLAAIKNTGQRHIIALAGAPAAGKSTVTDQLKEAFAEELAILPMDGFHLDNAILDAHGLRARKGAPETFDAEGFINAVRQVKAGKPLFAPAFDRELDLARAGAIEISTNRWCWLRVTTCF